jgi:hypothetical protein
LTPKIHLWLYIWLLFCLLAVIPTASQGDGSDFDLAETAGTLRVWHIADGLPADSVAAILQTPGWLSLGRNQRGVGAF